MLWNELVRVAENAILNKILREITSQLSGLCFTAAILSLVALVTTLLIEVVARYGLNAPNIWGYDVTRFLTATTLILATAWCQRNDSNIRIDALMTRVSPGKRAILEALFLAVLQLPALAVIAYASVGRAYFSFITLEVDPISPWAPRVWPFYLAIALGLVALSLQSVTSLVDAILRAMHPPPRDDNASFLSS